MISPRSKITDTILMACAGLLLALASPAIALAAATNCPPLASKALVDATEVVTTSTSYVNVAGTKIDFAQGGKTAGCVLVSFSAEATADPNTSMSVKVLLDGAIDCKPFEVFFVRSNAAQTDLAARAMNFVCPGAAPGHHSIRMQYSSGNGGGVTLVYRTTIVHYVP